MKESLLWRRRRKVATVTLAVAALPVFVGVDAVGAATIAVPCAAGGAGLVAAITAANDETSNPGPDIVELDAGCVYTLTELHNTADGPNGLPVITSPLTISGANSSVVRSAAPGTADFRIVHVSGTELVLSGLTIGNGSGSNPQTGTGGAGVLNSFGTLTVNESFIQNNVSSSHGGGIFSRGTLTLTNTVLAGNRAAGSAANGGGLWTDISATITDSTVRDNTAGGGGGGIVNLGTMTVTHTLIHANDALKGDGGGILNFSLFGAQVS
ncbi:MAG TPA: hypothetical protein VNT56_09805, partial [Acidimicrobiales bacterium]|nr:hypothetical protein [Acidimicrobiales bacterium]